MANEIVVRNGDMTIEAMKSQVQLIRNAMREVMHEGEHYGKIPGCGDKDVLYKPGAEKLAMLFGLCPSLDVNEKELPNNHREYRVTCTLTNRSGDMVGQGVGSCSTMESKYRYRKRQDIENTGRPVPKEYWDTKDLSKIGGAGFQAKKDATGVWMIHKVIGSGREENPDIADVYNTVLKMSKKRALVDAVITATSASDIFMQDIDETADPKPEQKTASKQPEQPTDIPDEEKADNLHLLERLTAKVKLNPKGYKELEAAAYKTSSVNYINIICDAIVGWCNVKKIAVPTGSIDEMLEVL